MAHEITGHDTVVLNKKKAWHNLGTIIEDDLTCVEAAERFGLTWEVDRWPLLARNPLTGELVEVEEHRANIRRIPTPEGEIAKVLGITGQNYQVCQNKELAEFMDALAQTGKVTVETAGSIRGGKRVWFLAHSDAYELPGGDTSYSYLLGSNAHDGTGAIRLDPTDIRVVCANTMRMVMPDMDGPVEGLVRPAAITIRHSGKLGRKLDEARQAIREYDVIARRHRELCHQLADQKIDRDGALQFFAHRYSETFVVEDQDADAKLNQRRRERMDQAAGAFLARFDAESKKFGGASAWLALNAWTGYCQHDLRSSGTTDDERRDNRIRSTLFGVGAKRTSVAMADAVAQFGVA